MFSMCFGAGLYIQCRVKILHFQNIIFCRSPSGTPPFTNLDEFSEKLQTAFDPRFKIRSEIRLLHCPARFIVFSFGAFLILISLH